MDTILGDSARRKVSLGKGYSLMDWIRYSKGTPNIAGNDGIQRKITLEELAKHNREDDCWTAIYDKVYNITPYIKYHPGGVEELLKGAGINCSTLFNRVHPWVNFQGMLEACLIGTLTTSMLTPSPSTKNLKASSDSALAPSPSPSFQSIISAEEIVHKEKVSNNLSLDCYQTDDKLVVVIYTKWKYMNSNFVIIEKLDKAIRLNVYVKEQVYEIVFDLQHDVTTSYDLKCYKEGKLEIKFSKVEKHQWSQSPNLIDFQVNTVTDTNTGIHFSECVLVKRAPVTHDTDFYTFKLPETLRMCVPVGYHVYLRLDGIVKPYTVVSESLLMKSNDEMKGKCVNLMIKHYNEGAMTSKLKFKKLDSKVELSYFTGSFNIEQFYECIELICICAGTGFTPMVKLLNLALQMEHSLPKLVVLLDFNKTVDDILWMDGINELKEIHKHRLEFTHILSSPNEHWTGAKGRISTELYKQHIPKGLKKPFFCICGPSQFTQRTIESLKNLGYSDDLIHAFTN